MGSGMRVANSQAALVPTGINDVDSCVGSAGLSSGCGSPASSLGDGDDCPDSASCDSFREVEIPYPSSPDLPSPSPLEVSVVDRFRTHEVGVSVIAPAAIASLVVAIVVVAAVAAATTAAAAVKVQVGVGVEVGFLLVEGLRR